MRTDISCVHDVGNPDSVCLYFTYLPWLIGDKLHTHSMLSRVVNRCRAWLTPECAPAQQNQPNGCLSWIPVRCR
jgi:hypothetical protein